jgi:uncharacterized protein
MQDGQQNNTLLSYQQIISIVTGVVLLIITLYPNMLGRIFPTLILNKQFQRVSRWQSDGMKSLFLGLLNGLLPCGLVYTAIALALVYGSFLKASVFMFAFGWGTMPSLLLLNLLQQKIPITWRKQFTRSTFILSLVVSVFIILRGMNLGIPYLSPKWEKTEQKMSCCERSRN